jgi:hypothetical protein
MERFKIINAQRITKAGENFDYYQLTLENSKGEVLVHPDSENNFSVAVTTKHMNQLLKAKQVEVGILMPVEIQALVESATINATVELKKAGETFVATEFSNPVTTDGGKTWIEPKKGEKYKIHATGYRIDYEEDVQLNVDTRLAVQFQREALAFAQSQRK